MQLSAHQKDQTFWSFQCYRVEVSCQHQKTCCRLGQRSAAFTWRQSRRRRESRNIEKSSPQLVQNIRKEKQKQRSTPHLVRNRNIEWGRGPHHWLLLGGQEVVAGWEEGDRSKVGQKNRESTPRLVSNKNRSWGKGSQEARSVEQINVIKLVLEEDRKQLDRVMLLCRSYWILICYTSGWEKLFHIFLWSIPGKNMVCYLSRHYNPIPPLLSWYTLACFSHFSDCSLDTLSIGGIGFDDKRRLDQLL